jgi:uroporphyrinogen-III synthase
LAERQFDVVLFTSSIQLSHLLTIADRLGLESEVAHTLREYTANASVGPVMSETMKAAGIPADIVPVRPKMAALVRAASEMAADVLAQKRAIFA